MNRTKKWRLVFDLAGLFGLLTLGLSLWFGHPHPKWRMPLGPAGTSALGFSADNQTVYSMKDNFTHGSRIPKPMLQRWETATGILESEYSLQVPAEDVAQIKLDPSTYLSYNAHLIQDNLLMVETPAGAMRLYSVESGSCLSQRAINRRWIWYLWQNPEDQHHWGMVDGSSNTDGAKAVLVDLTNGEELHTFTHSPANCFIESRLSSDRQYILMLWMIKAKEKTETRYELEIIKTRSWKSLIRLPRYAPAYGFGSLLKNNLLVQTSYFKANDLSENQLECFRFDPNNGTLKPDESHPFHGLVCNEWVTVNNDLLLRYGLRGSDEWFLPWWQKSWNAIKDAVRQGKLPEAAGQMDYFVYDFNTGRQLRQLTGLTAFGHQALQMSQDMRYLLGVEYVELNTPRQQTFLAIYEIPHYLWERTWNVFFCVSIFMIFLWPFRLLRKRIPLEPRPVPAP